MSQVLVAPPREQQVVYHKRSAFRIASVVLACAVALAVLPGQELNSLLVLMLSAVIAIMGFVEHKPTIALVAATLMWAIGIHFSGEGLAEFSWEVMVHNIHGYELVVFLVAIVGWVAFLRSEGVIDVAESKLVYAAEKSPYLLGFSLAAMASTLTTWMDEISGITFAKTAGANLAATGVNGGGELDIDVSVYRKQMWLAVLFGNLTSCATLVANPVTAAAALTFDLSFLGFVVWVWGPLILSWIVGFAYILAFHREDMLAIHKTTLAYYPEAKQMQRRHWWILVAMGAFVVLMFLNGNIDALFGLPHNTAFICIPVSFALAGYGVSVRGRNGHAREMRGDVWEERHTVQTILSLTFMVTIIEQFGFKEAARGLILDTSAGLPLVAGTAALFVTLAFYGTVITSLYDNVVATLALSGVVLDLELAGPEETQLAYAVVFICTVGSSLLPIGSIAGIQTQMTLRNLGHPFTTKEWVKLCGPFCILTLSVGLTALYFLSEWHVTRGITLR